MKQKLSLVTLGVSDLERSIRFYESLGWKPLNRQPGEEVAFFEMGGVHLSLFGREDLAADIGVPFDASTRSSALTLAHNEPSEADVDRAFEEFLAAGATEVKHPAITAWGGYSGYVADPDGHLWEVAFNPYSDWT
jgi:catechol 2,3-dioxygenase-like lactoylglutathione lyase family enzyme